MCSNHNGIFKGQSARQHHLLLDIDRPLPIGMHVSYVNTAREVIHATVVQAGYYVLVVYNDDQSISIIRYADLVAVG